jgi:hypothetical protein
MKKGTPLVTRSVAFINRERPRRPASHVARWIRSQSTQARRLPALRSRTAPRSARHPARRRLAAQACAPDRRGPPRAGLRRGRVDDRREAHPRHARARGLGGRDCRRPEGQGPRAACLQDRPDRFARLGDALPARPGTGDLASGSRCPRGARARPLSPSPGQAQVGAQEPDPLDADQLRPALPGHRPVRGRGQRSSWPASTSPSPGART